jgi:hypothetical protein
VCQSGWWDCHYLANSVNNSFVYLPPITPPWTCSSCLTEVLKSFPPINGLLILHEPMRIENDFSLLWNLRWEFLCPMEHYECSILQSNKMIILMTNGIGGFIVFLILDNWMGFLSSIIVNFVQLTLTSYFFILIILNN